MKEVQIKTSLFYLFGEQQVDLKESLNELFELEEKGFENIADILVYAAENDLKFKVNFERCVEFPEKHNKTFLAYFSSKEHKVVNSYLNSFLPNGIDSKMKKKYRTEIVCTIIEEIYEQLIN